MTVRKLGNGDPAIPGKYEVLSPKCVWGEVGEVIDLELTAGQEEALLRAGTVKRASTRPKPAAVVTKGNGNGQGHSD